VLLVLAYEKALGKYKLTSRAGAFSVDESGVQPLVTNLADNLVFERVVA
jgi:hypothetical protein